MGTGAKIEARNPGKSGYTWCRSRSGVFAEKFMRCWAQSDNCGSNNMPFENFFRRIQVEEYRAGCIQLPL